MRPEFYIINHTDRPYEKLVCQCIEENKLIYIHKDMRDWNKRNGIFSYSDNMTNIRRFGFEIIIKGKEVSFNKICPSFARYQNGTIRDWQGASYFKLILAGEEMTTPEEYAKEEEIRELSKNHLRLKISEYTSDNMIVSFKRGDEDWYSIHMDKKEFRFIQEELSNYKLK